MDVNHDRIGFSTAEMSFLWSNYIGDTMIICMLEHFLRNVEDEDIKSIISQGIDLAKKHTMEVKEFFGKENFPIPVGFGPEDVFLDAPRLFSDKFYLYYIRLALRGGIANYSLAFTSSHLSEVRKYFMRCIHEDTELFNKTVDLMLAKGLSSRPPALPVPKEVRFVNDSSFLGEWFGEERPLTSMEVTHLFRNIETNLLGSVLMTAFGQTVDDENLKKYFIDGINTSKNQIKAFTKILTDNSLAAPPVWDPEVTDSIVPAFSNKLMLYHASLATTAGIGNYGLSLSSSQRRDLALVYIRLTGEIAKYAEKGAEISIDYGWLEQPPMAIDRNKLLEK